MSEVDTPLDLTFIHVVNHLCRAAVGPATLDAIRIVLAARRRTIEPPVRTPGSSAVHTVSQGEI